MLDENLQKHLVPVSRSWSSRGETRSTKVHLASNWNASELSGPTLVLNLMVEGFRSNSPSVGSNFKSSKTRTLCNKCAIKQDLLQPVQLLFRRNLLAS